MLLASTALGAAPLAAVSSIFAPSIAQDITLSSERLLMKSGVFYISGTQFSNAAEARHVRLSPGDELADYHQSISRHRNIQV